MRPYRRAQRALESTIGLVFATFYAAIASEQSAKRRPLRAAQKLNQAVRKMALAVLRLVDARRRLAEAQACLQGLPEHEAAEARELFEALAERCDTVAAYIPLAVSDAVLVQMDVIEGLATGELVPEHPSDSRPRIVLKPRVIPVRAFLAARQRRVSQRIGPILRRRRRIPRPAENQVPRPDIQGRAPPLSSICLL